MFKTRERRRRPALADIVVVLARELLELAGPGSRLPTVRELASAHHSSPASIHAAIARLEEEGAIAIETRGRAGAFLVSRSASRLWAMMDQGPLVIAMPLASSPRYEALATAIKQVMIGSGVDVVLMFVRGSRQRLKAVDEGRCHLAVMSGFAAARLCGPGHAIAAELLPDSYNTGHRVYYVPERRQSGPLRVVVDPYSADQQLLSAMEFNGAPVTLVSAMTGQIARLLEAGQADAAIWTPDEMQGRQGAGIADRPLSPVVRKQVGNSDTLAVLVGRSADAQALRAVCEVLDPGEVKQIQMDVLIGRIVPEY
jgi:hypothetical protein